MKTRGNKSVARVIEMTMAISYGATLTALEDFGPEGWKATVATLADVAKAEAAARKLKTAYGLEVLVAF
jgi:hypothetical protein